jgi:hypothetical protein
MWSHLGVCKKFPFVIDRKQKTLVLEPRPIIKGGNNGEKNLVTIKAVGYSYEECRKALGKMIIVDELPFNFVENQGFKSFCQVMQPRFDVPSRLMIWRNCLKIYAVGKEKLKKALKNQHVCLTTDTWTSIQNINYMCLTTHWIDEGWNLNKRIQKFCQVSNHKGKTISQAIESCLLEWGIDNILTVTVDNARSNNLTIKYLKRVTSNWATNILSNDFMHVRCRAHIVNLIICAGLKDIDDSVVKIRNAVRFVGSSPSRQLVFNQCAERLKIGSKKSVCLDVATRWNSTYMMLDAADKFDVVFMRLEETDPRYLSYFEVDSKGKQKNLGPPALEDWEKARFFVKFLKLFYTITLKFSGSLYVTSNSFFHELIFMHTSISQLYRSEDVYVRKMAKNMIAKYKKYWGDQDTQNFLLYVAVVLDQRFKLKYVRFCFGRLYDVEEAENFTIKVKDTLIRLFVHYMNVKVVRSVGTSINENVSVDLIVVNDDMMDDLTSQFKKHLEEEGGVQKKNEVERYLGDDCEDLDDFKLDILGWWRCNATKYKILSKVAQHVLAILVSTVVSEAAFSTGGRILDSF